MEANGVRTLLAGRGLVESPRWHGDLLYFSDWSAGEVLSVDLAGHSEVIARVPSLPLCTAWLPDGRLVIVSSPEFQPGSVHLVTADGAVRQVADDIAFPNGMAVTGDNSTPIVADSYRRQLVGFDIGADGGLSGRRVWADLGEGVPDGICADAQDAVWYADVPGQRCVRVALCTFLCAESHIHARSPGVTGVRSRGVVCSGR